MPRPDMPGDLQNAERSLALPYLESLVAPRNRPDCRVDRSSPQNLRNCLW